MRYTIRETDDYEKLAQFYHDSDLEIALGEDPPGEIVKQWECVDEDGQLLAAETVLYKKDIFVLEDLAVADPVKGKGLGKKLLSMAEEEVRRRGEAVMWLCGKVPEYYERFGWETVDSEEAPDISLCQSCEKFEVTCFPRIMKKKL